MSNPVLVIGAGVAGMTAAIELADSGIPTVLVERLSTVGGNALDLYKAFPTDDCFYCFEGNRWRPGIRKCFYRSAMIDQPNISLKMNSEVDEISGTPGQFSVKLRIGPQYIDPKKCTMCGLCIEKSDAFCLLSPQCQPQAVFYDPTKKDDGAKLASEECPTKAIDLDAQSTEDSVTVSDIVIATGYQEMQPTNVDEYSYGKHPNIVTQLELAKILRETLLRLKSVLGQHSYNFIVHSIPFDKKNYEYYHWYIEIMPRLTRVAGFEWGTGIYILSTPPELATKYLKRATTETRKDI